MDDKESEYKKLVEELEERMPEMEWSDATQPVPGIGSLDADLMFIGEAPGAKEDELGEPFVGPAGKLLTELLNGIGLQRNEVYISNVLKYRPPENRDPKPDEVKTNRPFLEREIKIVNPHMIVLLGSHALGWFFPNEKITDLRGKAKKKDGLIFFPSYHPAAALYNPNLKETLQKDFARIDTLVEKLDELADEKTGVGLEESDETEKEQDSLF